MGLHEKKFNKFLQYPIVTVIKLQHRSIKHKLWDKLAIKIRTVKLKALPISSGNFIHSVNNCKWQINIKVESDGTKEEMKGPISTLLLALSFWHVYGEKAPIQKFQNVASGRYHPYRKPLVHNWNKERKFVNSDGAQNNCAYCTLAGAQGKTVDQLLRGKGGNAPMSMDSQYIPEPRAIQILAQQSGFPEAKFRTSDTQASLLNRIGQDFFVSRVPKKTYALAYNHANGGGHVLALNAWKGKNNMVRTKVIDYQQPNGRTRFSSTIPESRRYYLFDLGKQERGRN